MLFVKNILSVFDRLKLLLLFSLIFCANQSYSQTFPVAIFHAFNMKYEDLTDEKLSKISDLGFSHIQISPTQKSLEYGKWHDKYQPVAYQVNNRYGDENQLKAFTERAHLHQLKVIADVVFNHLAGVQGAEGQDWKIALENHDEAKLDQLKRRLFDSYQSLFPGFKSDQVFELFQPWNESGWMGGNLPQLNTKNPLVRKAQVDYLKTLQGLGVDGFRYDAAGSIDPESLAAYENEVKTEWSYGEVIVFQPEESKVYTDIFPITDYLLTRELIRAFSYSGTLQDLKIPRTNGRSESATFSVSHDMWAATQDGACCGLKMAFSDSRDSVLATAYILARHDGAPLILARDSENPLIQKALRFRREMVKLNAKMEYIVDASRINPIFSNQTLLVMARGDSGLMILNKAADAVVFQEANLSEFPDLLGCYKDMNQNRTFLLGKDPKTGSKKLFKSSPNALRIERFDASFFVRVSDTEC